MKLMLQVCQFLRFLQIIKRKMNSKNIQFHESVQNVQEWKFVKEKKERIKVKAQKDVNSQIYLTTYEENSVYVFLFFMLAPEQAFGFQKIQGILKNMKGSTLQENRQYDQCKRMLHINWDGTTPLTHLIKRKRKDIVREQKFIHSLSQRITQEDAKQLLKSALSQRKIHVDYYTNDGNNEQFIIPTIQNINDCVTIIYNEYNRRFLIAFFSHSQDQPEQKEQQKKQGQTHTFVDRPINPNAVNPDDRPLPPPENNTHPQRAANYQRPPVPVPTQPRKILDPEQKLLNPPSDINQSSKRHQNSSRNIANPDDRLLPLPPRVDKAEQKKRKLSDSKISASNVSAADKKSVATEVRRQPEQNKRFVNEVRQQLKQVGEKVVGYGKRAQEKVEHVVEQLRKDKFHWMELGVAALIIIGAVKILRS